MNRPAASVFSQATRRLGAALLSLGLALGTGLAPVQAARAQALSDASGASLLPVAVSLSVPVMAVGSLLAGGVALVVVSVKAVGQGSEWVLERVADGSRFTVRLAGQSVLVAGAAVSVVALSTGWLLVSAGKALCLIPNARGRDLLHHEALTR